MIKETMQKILNLIGQTIYDKKGFNILALDVKGLSSISDYLIIAEANVDRHGSAVARSIIDEMEKEAIFLLHSQGIKDGDWIVLDYGEVAIHLFCSPGLREKYALERLWDKSEIVDLAIDVSKKAI